MVIYPDAVTICRVYRLNDWPRERWPEPTRTYRLRFAYHIARKDKRKP